MSRRAGHRLPMRSSAPRGSACHRRDSQAARGLVDALGLDRLHQVVKEEHLGPAGKQLLRAQQRPSGAVIVAQRLDLEEARPADLVAPRQDELDPLSVVAGKLHQAQVEVLSEARNAPRHPRAGRPARPRAPGRRGRLGPQRAERHAFVAEPVEQRLGHVAALVHQPSPFIPPHYHLNDLPFRQCACVTKLTQTGSVQPAEAPQVRLNLRQRLATIRPMKNIQRRLTALASVLSLAAAPSPAPAFEAIDTHAVAFARLFPAYPAEEDRPVDVWLHAGVMRDSNILALGDQPSKPDTISRLGGGVRIDQRVAGRQRVRLDARGDYYKYNTFTDLDHFAYAVLGELAVGNRQQPGRASCIAGIDQPPGGHRRDAGGTTRSGHFKALSAAPRPT